LSSQNLFNFDFSLRTLFENSVNKIFLSKIIIVFLEENTVGVDPKDDNLVSLNLCKILTTKRFFLIYFSKLIKYVSL